MRSPTALLLLPLALVSYVHAQNSSELLEAAFKELPDCALNCMIASVSKSSCQLSDFYCISQNEKLNVEMTICVQANCTIREALITKNFTMTAYGQPVRNHTKLVSYSSMIGGGFALLAVVLRMFARIPFFGGTWGWDDWAMLVTLIPAVPLTALAVPLANYGLGKDMWTVPFGNITQILHIYYFDELFYLSSIALTKISILLFYLRIFPNQTFRRCVYGALTLCTLYILGFLPATALQCLPVRVAWERWDGQHFGKCFDLNREGWATAAFNIVFDLIVIFLPLGELYKLKMSRRKKLGIIFMFLGGIFVTIVSVVRVQYMIRFANSQNVTWDYTPVGYWSTIEVHVGIIIACLPALRSLQHRIFPDSRSPNSYYPGPSGGYGYNSKGGSPFPSIHRSKHTPLTTAASQASMIRSRDRKDDKDFIQLEEYEVSPGEDVERSRRFRGLNHTQVERGSLHSDEYPIQSPDALPTATLQKSSPLKERPVQGGWPQAISVRKDYSVTVEISPEQLSASPPRVSQDDEEGRSRRRRFSMGRVGGARRGSRSSSRRRIVG